MRKTICILLAVCLLTAGLGIIPAYAESRPREDFVWRAHLDDSFLQPENAWIFDLSENGLLILELKTYGTDYGPPYAAEISNTRYSCIGYRPNPDDFWKLRFSLENLKMAESALGPSDYAVNRDAETSNYLMVEVINGSTDTQTIRLWMSDDETNTDPADAKSSIVTASVMEYKYIKSEEIDREPINVIAYKEQDEKILARKTEEIRRYGYYIPRDPVKKAPSYNIFNQTYTEHVAKKPVYIDPLKGQLTGDTYDINAAGAGQFTTDTKGQDTTLSNNKRLTFTAVNAARTRNNDPIADTQLLRVRGNAGERLYKASWKTILPYSDSSTKRTIRIGYRLAKQFEPGLFEFQPQNPSVVLDLVFDSAADTVCKEAILYWTDDNEYHIPVSQLTCAGNFVERYLPVLYGSEAQQLVQKLNPQQQTLDTPDEIEIAERLQSLGLFSGTDTGFDLDSPFTRAQGAAMLVRLLGMETAAMGSSAGTGFSDVPNGHWAAPYVGYCARNGITNGTSEITFSPVDPMTGAQYAALLLRAMGYTDAQPDTALEEAAAHGMLTQSQLQRLLQTPAPFSRGGMVELSWGALKTAGTNGTSLADSLITRGVITKEQAEQTKLQAPKPAVKWKEADLDTVTGGILDF